MKHNRFRAYNIADLRDIARRRLPKGVFEFIDRGTEDDVALRNNRDAYERIKLKPRTLVDVSSRNQEITLFGQQQMMPIAIAPTGSAGLLWYQGEIELARAAAAASIPFTLAINSLTAMEKVAAQVGGRLWFQLYMWHDRAETYKLVERAKAAGYEALVFTVDTAVGGNHEYMPQNDFEIPISFTRRNVTDVLMHPRWLLGVFMHYLFTTGMPRFENYTPPLNNGIIAGPRSLSRMKKDPSWEYLRELRKIWPNKLIVKGILHPRDAALAADCGVDAVIVSNHGGRVLDSSMAPIEVLPQIVDAVGKRVTVIVDSGIRRGSDIVKALALGANAVLIGRATLYGTAVGGEAGAAHAIELLRAEIDRILALLGCRSVSALNHEHLVLPEAMETAARASSLDRRSHDNAKVAVEH